MHLNHKTIKTHDGLGTPLKLSTDKIKELYMSYFNDFLTVRYFAEYYGIRINTAQKIILKGRELCG